MPVPRLVVPEHKVDENRNKTGRIISDLCDIGYDICTAKEAIQVIETKKLDKSQFDFPYNSFEEFKEHVLSGELEIGSIDDMFMTKEEQERLDKAVREGELEITYS